MSCSLGDIYYFHNVQPIAMKGSASLLRFYPWTLKHLILENSSGAPPGPVYKTKASLYKIIKPMNKKKVYCTYMLWIRPNTTSIVANVARRSATTTIGQWMLARGLNPESHIKARMQGKNVTRNIPHITDSRKRPTICALSIVNVIAISGRINKDVTTMRFRGA